jgi:hypothetical protein
MMELGWWAFLAAFAVAALCGEFTWKRLRKEPVVIHIRQGSFRYAGQPRVVLTPEELAKIATLTVKAEAAVVDGDNKSKRRRKGGANTPDRATGEDAVRRRGRRK